MNDVMTRAVVSVEPAASYRDTVDLLTERRISAVPVIDDAGRVIGIVSEADLLKTHLRSDVWASAITVALTYAGHTWGLGRWWTKLPIVGKQHGLI